MFPLRETTHPPDRRSLRGRSSCSACWFLQLLSNAMSSGEGGGVAFRAHIGGFIAGMALIALANPFPPLR